MSSSSVTAKPTRTWLPLAVVLTTQLMIVLDAAIVNIALPDMQQALHILHDEHGRTPLVIDVCDSEYVGPGTPIGGQEYEALLARHPPVARLEGPADEWDAIAVSYTSGTTGDPKGVAYSHRSNVLHAMICAQPDMIGASARVGPITPRPETASVFRSGSPGRPR